MWKTVKLGDACLVRRGTTITKKQTIEGKVPVIGGGTKPTYFHNEKNREANCITVSGSGASAGFVNKWEVPIFASDCSTVEPKDETQLHQFIYYYLMSQQQFIYDNFRSGAAQPHVYARDLETLEYPVIPLAEQQRIVAKLDAAFAEIDRAIEVADKCVANSIAVYDTHLDKIFSELSISYSKQSMHEACDLIDSLHKTPKYTDDGYPMIRVADVKPGKIDFENAKRVDEATFREFSKRHTAREGDIILSRVGSYGVSAIVSENIDFCLGQNTVFVLPKCNSKYLYFFLNSPFAQRQMDSLISGVAQPTISLKSIKSLSIPLPNEEKQIEISENFEQLRLETQKASEILKRKRVLLEKLKSSILAQELQPPQDQRGA